MHRTDPKSYNFPHPETQNSNLDFQFNSWDPILNNLFIYYYYFLKKQQEVIYDKKKSPTIVNLLVTSDKTTKVFNLTFIIPER